MNMENKKNLKKKKKRFKESESKILQNYLLILNLKLLCYREVWPEDDCFGSFTAAPEDELMLLRDIFITNLGPGKLFTINL